MYVLDALDSPIVCKQEEKIGTPDIEEGQELEAMEGVDAGEEAIAEMMGFGGFGTTKVSSKYLHFPMP
jgi:hypothetical protein